MPYRICKSFEIENGHMLSKHPDVCRFPHGHSRKVEFVLEADQLDGNNMVCDFKVLRGVIHDFLMTWDHALCMNTSDPQYDAMKASYGERVVGFEGVDPTTEVMAKELFDVVTRKFQEYQRSAGVRYPAEPSVRVVRVRIWETSSSWAEYEPATPR